MGIGLLTLETMKNFFSRKNTLGNTLRSSWRQRIFKKNFLTKKNFGKQCLTQKNSEKQSKVRKKVKLALLERLSTLYVFFGPSQRVDSRSIFTMEKSW
jgi:hypothetical protein